ncbi:MAG: penicillin-binding protein [Acidobacteria bacterium]|nr:MAG: penicillin-binding protein [Acidobacteriota bacterium]PYQ84985.1 MAG: penicillin-binding protein [Acidobacteriota bacterium]PYQ90332.1 MAG: penicillin-binding protein [Acidobacteriota bacterium]
MGIWSTTAATACLAIFASIWFVVDLQRGLPDTEAIQRIGEMRQSTAVFDADDQLAFTIFEEQRIPVALDHISPNLIHAVLAVEDQRFYDHHGFDLARIVKAALTNLRHGRVVQGGSTITQQLARQSFLTPDKTIRRKLQELILAARIESEYSKDRILELYLNKVYFGDGLYGAEASARGYFGRHASEVSVSEAALLAGLVKSPSTSAPTVNPTRAKARRNVVLQAMLDTGAIDPATWTTARRSDVVLHDTLRAQEPHGQYFKEQVRRELVDRFGWQRVYQGGLRVFSTMALPMQIAAEEAIAASLKSVEERRRKFKKLNQDDVLQAALIALDPQSGHVWAMVGGRDFNESRFNRAVQARRQPGSAFKPFVYATALEAGYTPVTVIDHLNDPVSTVQGAWTPEDEHSSAGAMTMRTALRTSSNRAAVRMLQQVGIARTVQYAKQLGVGDVPSVPSLALGSGEVTLDSMTAAYAAFANHGLVPKPLLIRRVEDQDGRLLFENHETTTRAISDVTAFLMSTMMADVINAGTGARARRLGFTLPAAGKTGTTNDFNDAWFVGYTPHLAAGVWVGFDQPHTIVPNGFAADIAVPAWATFMKAATKNDKPEWLLPPPGITTATVCRISGKLATEGCQDVEVVTKDDRIEHRSMIYTEYFARGTEPTSYCDLHPTRGMLTKITAALGGETPSPSPARVDETGTPTPTATSGASAPTGAVVSEAPEMTPSPPVKKKRGFWSRVFGLGKDSEDGKPEAETKAPKKKPGG